MHVCRPLLLLLPLMFLLGGWNAAEAQSLTANTYDIGTPVLLDLWVSVTGNDSNSGTSASAPLRTVAEAWQRIPGGQLSSTGYRINIGSGAYQREQLPNYWESKHGSARFPIILQGATSGGGVTFLGDMNVFDVRYLYVMDIRIAPGGDAFHCEQCQATLLRRVVLDGGARAAHDLLKVNQSQYFYLEDSDIHGADDNAVDFVAVQYGHVARNRVHDSQDWCMYAKGGSAYLLFDSNEVYDCGTGGITAGQGAGFEFMTAPWLHFEAYDLKIVNNIIHDTEGAGLGVNGGYNILAAFNTLVRVGRRSHLIEVVFGARSCDGDSAACQARHQLGGWGPTRGGEADYPIGNRNVLILNNVVYNPAGMQSGSQHFAIYGPRSAPSGSNIPSPQRTDERLVIRGNLIWNGESSMPLGVEDSDQGCQPGNPTCTAAQLRADNAINQFEPEFLNFAARDFRPAASGSIFRAPAVVLPAFLGGDREPLPLAPQGELGNSFPTDRGGAERNAEHPVAGAYGSPSSRLDPVPGTPGSPPSPPSDPGSPPANPPSGDSEAPQIRSVSLSKRQVKHGKSFKVTARIVDNSRVAGAWIEVVGSGDTAMKGKRGKYSGSVRVAQAGRYSVIVHAVDAANNEAIADGGTIAVR